MSGSVTTRAYAATRIVRGFDVPYDRFTAALDGLLGQMDPAALAKLPQTDAREAREQLGKFVGSSGFAIFQKLDHGALRTAFTGRPSRAITYVFGNALIAIEMTKEIAEVGLYVPLRMFVAEDGASRVRVTYDLPSATLAQFDSAGVDEVGRELDVKVDALLTNAAAAFESGESGVVSSRGTSA